MPFGTGGEFTGGGGGGSGGGGGGVTSVSAADTSVVVTPTTGAVTVATNTLDVIAADHPPAANWSNNSHKITSLANGTAATDAAAFGQIPTTQLNTYTTSTITADPAPGVAGTYYRANYAASGTFTLPTTTTAGQWIQIKQIANNMLSIVGTVDGSTTLTMAQNQSYLFIANGTNWDLN